MCGIVGAYGWVDDARLGEMLDCLVHRGPDEAGRYRDSDVMMGARRLSIVDREGGSQPKANEEGDVHVVFNGEIYNHRAVRAELESRGHRFESDCDTEVLVHLWEEYGTDMVEPLDGMFAFSIRDRTEGTVFLARDRLGIKPLYYACPDERVIWASEMGPLLLAGADTTIDEQAVYNYFSLKYTPWPETLLTGVRKLPPGGAMLVDETGVREWSYWDLEPGSVPERGVDAVADRVRALLDRSVRNRLMADVPVGAFLSGGLDSSAIVGLAAQHTEDLKTYSIGFGDARYDESSEASFVAEHFGTDHTTLSIDLSAMDLFADLVAHHGEPMADAAALPTALLAERASEDVKVVLTGSGADELFAGYRHYRILPRHRRWFRNAPETAFRVADVLADGAPVGNRHFAHFASLASDERAYLDWWRRHNPPVGTYLEGGDEAELRAKIRSRFGDADDAFRRISRVDVRQYLPDDLLYLVDRATMSASIEGRVPFLDHRLVEYLHGVPERMKTDGEYKPLLRRATADLLPERTRSRTKQQFAVPIAAWFREDHTAITRWLAHHRLDALPHVDAEQAIELWDAHRSGENYESVLWRLLNYSAWYHSYLPG